MSPRFRGVLGKRVPGDVLRGTLEHQIWGWVEYGGVTVGRRQNAALASVRAVKVGRVGVCAAHGHWEKETGRRSPYDFNSWEDGVFIMEKGF